MVSVLLYEFNKRINSTKIPNVASTPMTGELKESFTLTGLSVKFALTNPNNVPMWNYAKIVELKRYYFITDWYFSGGFWYAQMAVDVLASNREQILNSRQYVTRSTSAYDVSLLDSAYTPTGRTYHTAESISAIDFWGSDVSSNSGTIVLGVINSSGGSIGAVSYYAMSMLTFSSLMNNMLNSIDWAGISATEISQQLQKALINPTQYIVSCVWYPVILDTFSASPALIGSLPLGWWSFTVSGTVYQLQTPLAGEFSRTTEIDIPKNIFGQGRRQFLHLAPYSTYTLKMPPFGVFELDSAEMYDKDVLIIRVDVNALTGNATLRIGAFARGETWDTVGRSILQVEGSVGVPLIVGQIAGDISNYRNALTVGAATGIAGVVEAL